MSNISTFNFQSNSVRVVFDEKNTPLFVAKDVATALNYQNVNDAISRHCKGVAKYDTLETTGGKQNLRVIYEPDVYRLIFGSKLESAIKFQDWVFEEVLPAIRKTGEYRLTISPEQQRAIQEAVNAKVRKTGLAFQTIYHELKIKFNIPRYNELLAKDFDECMAWLGAKPKTHNTQAPVSNEQLYKTVAMGLDYAHQCYKALQAMSLAMHLDNDVKLNMIANEIRWMTECARHIHNKKGLPMINQHNQVRHFLEG